MKALYRVSLVIEVDEDALAAHDGKTTPPPNNLKAWEGCDLFAAARLGIVDASEAEIEDMERLEG